MSREIRYRAWGKNSKEYLGYGTEDGISLTLKNIQNIEDLDSWIFEQYTGLKDKNGKEIYEGDIAKWNDCIMKVVWENDCACFELAYPDNSIEEGMCVNEYMKNWIIVGNIHKNPELLEEK